MVRETWKCTCFTFMKDPLMFTATTRDLLQTIFLHAKLAEDATCPQITNPVLFSCVLNQKQEDQSKRGSLDLGE